MNDIANWLGAIGLERYSELFESHEIDVDILSDITDENLKEMGVALGARLKILKCIRGQMSGGSEMNSEHIHVEYMPSSGGAERRHLTVMFIDLVGSTQLSEALDPEDLSQALRKFRNAVVLEIARYSGYVAKYLGDGILVYFGYPVALEDSVERSLLAALGVLSAIDEMGEFNGNPVQCRIGVASGLVVVGESVGEGDSHELAVVGEAPNLAARLQAEAAPNEIIVADSTKNLAAENFDFESMSKRKLKGFSEEISLWKVNGISSGDSEAEVIQQRRSACPFLAGRDAEMSLMLEKWKEAGNGYGQVVFISAEAGLGKSCLTDAFLYKISDDAHTRIRYQCSSIQEGTAFYPVIQQLTSAAGIESVDSQSTKVQKLSDVLQQSNSDEAHIVECIADLLSIKTNKSVQLTGQQKREQTFQILLHQLNTLATESPVVFVVEDLHWVDPSTLELITRTIESIESLRVLVIITTRQSNKLDLTAYPYLTELVLSRLNKESTLSIIQSIGNNTVMPDHVLTEILTRTDGVPLFIEEMTKSILESGQQDKSAASTTLSDYSQSYAIPVSLHDSLLARLDRLSSVKLIAQTASCIGREFTFNLLDQIVEGSTHETKKGLKELMDAGLVHTRRGKSTESYYQFKHALVRDTAYESLLRTKRTAMHAKLATVLEAMFEDTGSEEPQTIAHHYSMAGNYVKASEFWLIAGNKSTEQYANAEAVTYFSSIVQLDRKFDSAVELNWKHLLDAHRRLGSIYALTGEYADAKHHYLAGLEIADREGRSTATIDCETRLGTVLYLQGNTDGAATHIERAIKIAGETNDSKMMSVALQNRGSVYFSSGSIPKAIECYNEAFAICEKLNNRIGLGTVCTLLSSAYNRSGDPVKAISFADQGLEIGRLLKDQRRIAWLNTMIGESRALLGDLVSGQEVLEQGYVIAEKVGDLRAMAWNRLIQGMIGFHRTDYDLAIEDYRFAVTYGRDSGGFQHEVSFGLNGIAECQLKMGEYKTAEETCIECLDIAEPMNNKLESGATYTFLALICGYQGKYVEASSLFEQGISACQQVGSRIHLGKLHLAEAEISQLSGDVSAAHQSFIRAKDVFAKTTSKLFNSRLDELEKRLEDRIITKNDY